MKRFCWLLGVMSFVVSAQTIERKPVDVIYGNQLIRSEHQVVLSSPDAVSVIPAEQVEQTLGPNFVIAADGSELSYLEENDIAKREQEIYDEVNRRTEEAPFTVLFTGNIPEKIQERRLRMMPEIGVVNESIPDSSSNPLDVGAFSPVGQGVNSPKSSNASVEELEKLDALIGG
ncbi:hypothetical protein ABFY09_08255 [Marinomonas sp. 5E14-1]|uniref:hypothetical protein n=1 Tax=Marinomonas sp. 5E14-1 TaxID=3153922 RepID=UPI003264195E